MKRLLNSIIMLSCLFTAHSFAGEKSCLYQDALEVLCAEIAPHAPFVANTFLSFKLVLTSAALVGSNEAPKLQSAKLWMIMPDNFEHGTRLKLKWDGEQGSPYQIENVFFPAMPGIWQVKIEVLYQEKILPMTITLNEIKQP